MNDIDWEAMKNTDIMTVDPSALVDIQDVKIDAYLSKSERLKQYINQIGNPYCYKFNDIVIKINHNETTATITDRLKSFISDI